MNIFTKLKKNNHCDEVPKIYSLCIDEIYSLDNLQTLVIGQCMGGEIYKNDEIYILGPYGQSQTTRVYDVKKVSHPHKRGLILDNISARELQKGYIITNNNPHSADTHVPLDNPYLHYLLEEIHHQNYDLLDQLFEEITVRSHFLSVVEQNGQTAYPTIMVDDQNWYPVFTSQEELNRWHDKPGEKTFVFSFSDYVSMVTQQEDVAGIIINPYHKERNIVLKKDVMQYMENVKQNNVQQYLKQRKQFQKYYHRHRYLQY